MREAARRGTAGAKAMVNACPQAFSAHIGEEVAMSADKAPGTQEGQTADADAGSLEDKRLGDGRSAEARRLLQKDLIDDAGAGGDDGK